MKNITNAYEAITNLVSNINVEGKQKAILGKNAKAEINEIVKANICTLDEAKELHRRINDTDFALVKTIYDIEWKNLFGDAKRVDAKTLASVDHAKLDTLRNTASLYQQALRQIVHAWRSASSQTNR